MSQFDALFQPTAKEKTQDKSKREPKKKKSNASLSPAAPETLAKPLAEKRGGKSSNPDYSQVLTYIRRDTHNRVKAALIFDEKRRDLSDLVEELLAAWVKKKS